MAEQDDRLARLEALMTAMDRRNALRFEQLEKAMVEGFAALNQHLDDVDRHLNGRIDDVVHRLDGLDTWLLAIEGRLTTIEQGKADKWAVNLWGTTVIGWTSLLAGAAVALLKLWP
jgi:hypothetical protein